MPSLTGLEAQSSDQKRLGSHVGGNGNSSTDSCTVFCVIDSKDRIIECMGFLESDRKGGRAGSLTNDNRRNLRNKLSIN